MRRAVVFTPEAQADLIGLYDFVAERGGEERAVGYLRRIEKTCLSLASMPHRGADRSNLRPGLRVMGFERRVAIAFRVGPDAVAILRVLYGGRNLALAFGEDKGEE